MNLQGLGKVEDYQKYLDMAYKNGADAAMQSRQDTTSRNKAIRSRRIESARIEAYGKSLINSLDFIGRSFPSIDQLAPFYQELIKCTLDYPMLKQSLGALNWAKKQLTGLLHKYTKELSLTTRIEHFNKLRRAFSGRTSSVMKQIKDNLTYLEYCRKTMKGYPSLKTKVNTVVIAGAPNVGKSTLLAVLTGSKPEIASYPFTTQKVNLGYDAEGNQYIDTPGLLDRPIEARNKIEKQAILALKHLATIIIFVIDPTETCGYTVVEQKNLLQEIKDMFTLPIIIVANKADTGAIFKHAIEISAKEGTGIDKLKKEITSLLKAKQEKLQQ
ncbi:putative GTP-binding protein EngB [uncultured archaeon]|nr:putative GTP-binding protein EngB [uncultured archaeon]